VGFLKINNLFYIALSWRALLLWSIIVVAQLSPYRPNFAYTSPTYFAQYSELASTWIAPWANFDGVHYLQISTHGYHDQARFLPLLPLTIAFTTKLLGFGSSLGTPQLLIAFITTQVIFAASIYWLLRLVRLDYSKEIGTNFLWAVLAFPTAFFLVSVYAESLFLLLTALSFWHARKNQWGKAIIWASLLTITRLSGIVILPTLLLELWLQTDSKQFIKTKWQKLTAMLVIPLPLIGYAYYNFSKWGEWLYFISAHGELGNSRATSSLVFPGVTLYRYLRILITLSPAQYEFWVALLEIGFLGVVTGLLFLAWKQKVRVSYLLFATLAVSIPVLSGTLSGFPRYSLVAFPIYLAIAQIKQSWIRNSAMALGFGLQLLLLGLFSRGYFVA